MKPLLRAFGLLMMVVILLGAAAVLYLMRAGLSAIDPPGPVETAVARTVRGLTIPRPARQLQNPVTATPDVLTTGREHFADHCAICHANDGSGDTEMGRKMFPPAPDMKTVTQELTDGELFWIIENGIRFTGMPGWATGTKEGEEASWHLVHFIRHLPEITQAEIELMQEMNPRPPAEIRQEIEAEQFLRGGDPAPPAPHAH